MLGNIRITGDEMKFIQLLQNITGATVMDCIVEGDSIIFTVKKGEIGLAVGKGGEKIKRIRALTNKQVEVYEYVEDPDMFLRGAMRPAKVNDVRIVDRGLGGKIAMITIEAKDKGIAIGRNGENIKRIRFLAKRYFEFENVVVS